MSDWTTTAVRRKQPPPPEQHWTDLPAGARFIFATRREEFLDDETPAIYMRLHGQDYVALKTGHVCNSGAALHVIRVGGEETVWLAEETP